MPPLKGPMLAPSSPATSGLSRTAATLVTIASAASATAPAPLGRPINLVLRHAAPQISRPTGSMLPPPSSDMLQSHRTGSEVAPLKPPNHPCCRACSYLSPSWLSEPREGSRPSTNVMLPSQLLGSDSTREAHQSDSSTCRPSRGQCLLRHRLPLFRVISYCRHSRHHRFR